MPKKYIAQRIAAYVGVALYALLFFPTVERFC